MKKSNRFDKFKNHTLSRTEAQQIVGGRVRVQCTLSNGGSHIVEADNMNGIFDGIDAYNSYARVSGRARIVGCAL